MEVVRLRSMDSIRVAELAQWLERVSCLVQVAYPCDHVDDRLRGEALHGCRADMVDAAFEPRCERILEPHALPVEEPWPHGSYARTRLRVSVTDIVDQPEPLAGLGAGPGLRGDLAEVGVLRDLG
jgi:hypothetical protein